jgi:hypothetical protein
VDNSPLVKMMLRGGVLDDTGYERATILPYRLNTQTNQAEWALPGLLADPMRAWMRATDNAMAGIPPQAADLIDPALAITPAGLVSRAGGLGMGMVRPHMPMDEASRMARAAEQGYTIDAFKGSPPTTGGPVTNGLGRVIREEPEVPITSFDSPDAPYAGFFSSDPEVANRFARVLAKTGAVYPTKLKFDNPVVIDAKGKPAAAFQFESVAKENGTLADYRAFRGAFDGSSKSDGVILKNTADEGDVYVPRTPQQVRSRFAAFDPAQMKSRDIMASGLFGALGLLGTGDY